jgi:hypothetical protein
MLSHPAGGLLGSGSRLGSVVALVFPAGTRSDRVAPGGHSKRNARYGRFPNIMGGTYKWGGSGWGVRRLTTRAQLARVTFRCLSRSRNNNEPNFRPPLCWLREWLRLGSSLYLAKGPFQIGARRLGAPTGRCPGWRCAHFMAPTPSGGALAVPWVYQGSHHDKGRVGESQRRKATDPRLFRDKAAGLPKETVSEK